jgi:4-hydroxy-tetrahydrodipicolinate synthase
VTPLKQDLSLDLDGLTHLINFLASRGCHGILLMGTTGEGPSFSQGERIQVFQAASNVRQFLPDLHLLAGTGTPSLDETISITHAAFDFGFEGVVVLPPYYYRKATDEGLFAWFSQLLDHAVPTDGTLLGYHIPPVSGMALSLDLLSRLKDAYPDRFAGIKDSSGDPDYALALGARFGKDLLALNGNDRLFSLALQAGAAGCITAMANVLSPLLRQVWDAFKSGGSDEVTQEKLSSARTVLDRYPPMPPLLKVLLSRLHGFPAWTVKPPLADFNPNLVEIMLSEYLAVLD